MKTICDLSLSGRPPRGQPAFSPLALMTAGAAGVWFDPSDRSTLFQDSAGTIPVTAFGQPVGRMLDRGPNGAHAVQSGTNARPTYAAGANGLGCLVFDGVDDFMTVPALPLAGAGAVTTCIGQRKTADAGVGTILSLGTSSAQGGNVQVYAPRSGTNYGFRGFTSAAVAMDVTTAGFAAPDLSVLSASFTPSAPATQQIIGRRNGVEVCRGGTGLAPAFSAVPLNLGLRGPDLPYRGELYGLWFAGLSLPDARLNALEVWMAGKIGVTI